MKSFIQPKWIFMGTLLALSIQVHGRRRGIADFGPETSEYMNMMGGGSSFNFSPEGSSREARTVGRSGLGRRRFPGFGKRNVLRNDPDDYEENYTNSRDGPEGKTGLQEPEEHKERDNGLGDFGGDYGNYLKLLEGDQISDNQDLQTDVFGGGMSSKYWDMYKGSTSFDSMDDEDGDVAEELGLGGDDGDLPFMRQAAEVDQPEDAPNDERSPSGEESYIVAFKPPKEKMVRLYDDIKTAFKDNDERKMSQILDSLDVRDLIASNEAKPSRRTRKILVIDDKDEKESEPTTDSPSKSDEIKEKFDEFVEKMAKNIPDPVETNKGLSIGYRNLTIFGLSTVKPCETVKKSYGNHWKGYACLPNLSSAITTASGPGVPFRGKVIGIFQESKIKITFRVNEDSEIHIISTRLSSDSTKFIPMYDSSIPLNPWSKVSMSGYMVSKIKKVLPVIINKTLLKLTHIVENLGKDSKKRNH